MYIIIILSGLLLLLHKASALPATLELPSNLQQYHSTNISGTLTRDNPPWGPPFFGTDMVPIEDHPIDRRIFFSTIIQLLASQAHLEIIDPIPEDIFYRTREFPNFVISIRNKVPNQNILRENIFWAMTRILNQMVHADEFWGAQCSVTLRGREIASIVIGNIGTDGSTAGLHTLDGLNETITQSNQTDATVAAGNNNGVNYTYKSWGVSLTQGDIFMGTVGALYQAAGETAHDFEHFVSEFPGYEAYILWDTGVRPSRFTFNMLIGTIVGSAKFAVARNDYRELSGVVIAADGELIASGGWMKTLGSDGAMS